MDLDIEPQEAVIPELPEISYAFSRSASAVTLRWKADRKEYAGYSIAKYNIYLNGENVAAADAVSDDMEYTLEQQPEGYPSYSIEAIYADNSGQTLASPMSDAVNVAVTTDFSLPLKEWFDYSLETNYWTSMSDYGNAYDTNQTIFYQAGVENGPGLYSTISSREPYSFSLVSHALDAREENSVAASFGFIYALLNDMTQTLSGDYISLEVSTDCGDTWLTAGKWALSELSPGNYCFKVLDISDLVAGKIFWLRIHREGDGSGMYISGTDNVFVTVADNLAAPEGLTGMKNDDGSLALSWKSPSGACNLNHLGNLRTMNMSFGNDGGEMICANRFTPEDLAPYKDKYISSVSALINYFAYQEDVKGIHATAVILVDGEIVREQEFDDVVYNDYNVTYLDEPLQIDATKEMTVGIRLHDYDEWQWPAVAAVADDYIPGKTDLYTEDGGNTWLKLSDLHDVEDIQGHCLWDITAHISDTPETVEIDHSLMPFIYTVYRNDEIVNVVAIDGNATRFLDHSPLDHASYRVSMQSKDGENSSMSDPFEFGSDNVCMLREGKANIHFDASTGILSGDNDILRITLYNTDGRVMASVADNQLRLAGIPSGLYVAAITYADKILSAKIIIR